MASSTPRLTCASVSPASAALVSQVRASASSGGSSSVGEQHPEVVPGRRCFRLRRPWSTRCGPRPALAGPAWWRAAPRGCTWASVCPASAALVYQVRASASSGGSSSVSEQQPEVDLGVGVPGFGGLGPPGAGLGQLRRVQPVSEQQPEVVPGRRCARLRRPWSTRCGPRPAPAGPAGQRAARPRLYLRVGVPGFGGLGVPGAGLGQLRRVQPVSEQQPEAVLGVGVPGFGGLGPPGAGLGQVRRVQQLASSTPEVVLSVGMSRLRRPWSTRCGPRPAPAGPARLASSTPEAVLGVGVSGFGGLGRTRCGPRPAPAGPARWRAATRG